MTDGQDPKVSAAYRALGAEEPPRALDDAILAAARREAGARPGAPGRAAPRRWYASLAAAAVLVLAVAVTLHMQLEQPDIAEPAPAAKQAAAPPAAAPAEVVKEAVKEEVKPARPKAAEMSRRSEPKPFPADRAAAVPQVPAAPQAGPAPMLAKRATTQAKLETESPERELERIAELRRQGRHDEADKALAEFRKRHPDYVMSEAVRERVERR